MGVITTKLNAEWVELKQDEDMFAIRAAVQELGYAVEHFFSQVADKYPTGDATFDAYLDPLKDDVLSFKTLLNTTYGEFKDWEQPPKEQ